MRTLIFTLMMILATNCFAAPQPTVWLNSWDTNRGVLPVFGLNNLSISNRIAGPGGGTNWDFFGIGAATVARLLDVTNISRSIVSSSNGLYVLRINGGSIGQTATNFTAVSNATISSVGPRLNFVSTDGVAMDDISVYQDSSLSALIFTNQDSGLLVRIDGGGVFSSQFDADIIYQIKGNTVLSDNPAHQLNLGFGVYWTTTLLNPTGNGVTNNGYLEIAGPSTNWGNATFKIPSASKLAAFDANKVITNSVYSDTDIANALAGLASTNKYILADAGLGTNNTLYSPTNTAPASNQVVATFQGLVGQTNALIRFESNGVFKGIIKPNGNWMAPDGKPMLDYSVALDSHFIAGAGNLTHTGARNIGIGLGVLAPLSSGTDNTVIGADSAGGSLTTGTYNTLIGSHSAEFLSDGVDNVAVGGNSLYAARHVNSCTAIGRFSLEVLTNGDFNTAIGKDASKVLLNGRYNTVVGGDSMLNNVYGQENSAFGVDSLMSVTNSYNSAFGTYSLQFLISGISNVAAGYQAGISLVSGSNNIFIGPQAGALFTNGSYNIFIGDGVGISTNSGNNLLNIGNLIFGKGLASVSTLSTGSIGIGSTNPAARLDAVLSAGSTGTPIFHAGTNFSAGASTDGFRVESNGIAYARGEQIATAGGATTSGKLAIWNNNASLNLSSSLASDFSGNMNANSLMIGNASATAAAKLDATNSTAQPVAIFRQAGTLSNSIAAFKFTNNAVLTIETNGIRLANGGVITNILTASATLDFPSTLAQTDSDLPITVTGALPGDAVQLGAPTVPLTGSTYTAFASNDTVFVRFSVYGIAAKDPASGTFKVIVTQQQ